VVTKRPAVSTAANDKYFIDVDNNDTLLEKQTKPYDIF
jgi:hypothetical protein